MKQKQPEVVRGIDSQPLFTPMVTSAERIHSRGQRLCQFTVQQKVFT